MLGISANRYSYTPALCILPLYKPSPCKYLSLLKIHVQKAEFVLITIPLPNLFFFSLDIQTPFSFLPVYQTHFFRSDFTFYSVVYLLNPPHSQFITFEYPPAPSMLKRVQTRIYVVMNSCSFNKLQNFLQLEVHYQLLPYIQD